MRRFYESEAGQGQHNDKTLKEFSKTKNGNTKKSKAEEWRRERNGKAQVNDLTASRPDSAMSKGYRHFSFGCHPSPVSPMLHIFCFCETYPFSLTVCNQASSRSVTHITQNTQPPPCLFGVAERNKQKRNTKSLRFSINWQRNPSLLIFPSFGPVPSIGAINQSHSFFNFFSFIIGNGRKIHSSTNKGTSSPQLLHCVSSWNDV